MLKFALVVLLPLSIIFYGAYRPYLDGSPERPAPQKRDVLEKLVVANGAVTLDLFGLNPSDTDLKTSRRTSLRFDASGESFFTIKVFNGELRGPMPGTLRFETSDQAVMASIPGLLLERLDLVVTEPGDDHDVVIRDGRSGTPYFYVEGIEYAYDAAARTFTISDGRLYMTKELAAKLGRPADAGILSGQVSMDAAVKAFEIVHLVNGSVIAETLPPSGTESGTVPGPDVVVGDLFDLQQFGSGSGTQVGLAVGTESCNFGTENLHWFANPSNDHPTIPQNLYRMSGGSTNDERFEQIGQSNVKHAFSALTDNWCNLGCNGVGGDRLGSGCSDPYSASLNSGQGVLNCSNCLGSRSWINPFTGAFPRNDSATPNNSHAGHSHTGTSHRILTETADLSTAQNPGAKYFAEAQYVTPHEYVWCQTHPTQCNMYNNVSHRQYRVVGTNSPFAFAPNNGAGTQYETVRMQPAVAAWTGSTRVEMRPDPGNDGIGFVAYKVTQTSPGLWHYEYAVYNQNLDRAIQSFAVPLGAGAVLTNIGFHAPPQHPGWTADGTVGNAGYSSTPWAQNQAVSSMTWSTETFAQNQNANAIRWGTMYNFRFDSNKAPVTANATVGFFKTGSPVSVAVLAPADLASNLTLTGRVFTSGTPRGLGSVRITLSDGVNPPRTTYTNSFGFYRFDNITAGAAYTLTAAKLSHTFTPKQMAINNNLTDINFVSGQ